MREIYAHAERSFQYNGVPIWFHRPLPGQNSTAVAKPLVFEDRGQSVHVDPTVILSHEDAQALLDQLYMAGFRPSSEAHGPDKKQYEQHIDDLRRIAFHSMGIQA